MSGNGKINDSSIPIAHVHHAVQCFGANALEAFVPKTTDVSLEQSFDVIAAEIV